MKEALKLALEALKNSQDYKQGRASAVEAVEDIEEALEQPEQEPVGEAHLIQEGFTHCIWSESIVPVGTKFYTTPPQRKPLPLEQVNLFINGRGDEDDDDYVEPTGDGFGLTDADLVRLVRRVEAAHDIKEQQ